MKKIKVRKIWFSDYKDGDITTLYETKNELINAGISIEHCGVMVEYENRWVKTDCGAGFIQVGDGDSYEVIEDYGLNPHLNKEEFVLPAKWVVKTTLTKDVEKYLVDKYGEVDNYIDMVYGTSLDFYLYSEQSIVFEEPSYMSDKLDEDYTLIAYEQFVNHVVYKIKEVDVVDGYDGIEFAKIDASLSKTNISEIISLHKEYEEKTKEAEAIRDSIADDINSIELLKQSIERKENDVFAIDLDIVEILSCFEDLNISIDTMCPEGEEDVSECPLITFLKENDAYDKFVKNLKDGREDLSIEDLYNSFHEFTISNAFVWNEFEGFDYWKQLNNKFKEYSKNKDND
jgi:hypothetical protein